MKIIVEHRETKQRFLFLGAGFGSHASAHGSFLLGQKHAGSTKTICIMNEAGRIYFVEAASYHVVLVEGLSPMDFHREINDPNS